jgi:hypothetical protein
MLRVKVLPSPSHATVAPWSESYAQRSYVLVLEIHCTSMHCL